MQAERIRYYMQQALELASRARGRTFPNPLVGALVVKNGKICGRGYHEKAGMPHAEIIALKEAGAKAKGASLFCTFEPCFHEGRTPPCVEKVISSGVAEVYIGSRDPNPLTKGKSIDKLRRSGIKVFEGILQEDVRRLNEAFFCAMIKKRPLVTVKIACSMDGRTATRAGFSKWITSDVSRAHAHRLRGSFDSIMAGINTVLKDDPRLEGIQGHRLTKIIVDSGSRLPLSARLLKTRQPVIVAVTRIDKKKEKALRERGATVLKVKNSSGRVDLKDLMLKLGQLEMRNILVEGGSELIGSLLDEKLADKALFYIAPLLLGGRKALGCIGGEGARLTQDAVKLKDIKVDRIGNDLLIEGDLDYPAPAPNQKRFGVVRDLACTETRGSRRLLSARFACETSSEGGPAELHK